MTTIDEALAPGTHVSGYVIERVLGQGGFAFTYLAHDEHLTGSKFALKEFFPQELARRTQRVQIVPTAAREQVYREGLLHFIEEGRALLPLRGHAGIVGVQRFLEANGTAYLVMDYIAGESLQQALANSPRSRWNEALVRGLSSQVLESLGVVHQAGLLHRDINPSNIMLTPAGRPVLIDFGASRQQLAERTRTGDRVATAGYSPPEQYSHELGVQAASSDLYALGATLYEVVTGAAPPLALSRITGQFRGRDSLTAASERVAGQYSAELLAWIDWHLTLNQEQRPASVMQSLARLAQTQAPPAVPAQAADNAPVRTTPVDPKLRFPTGSGTPGGSPAAAPVTPESSKPHTTPVDPAKRFAGHVPLPKAAVVEPYQSTGSVMQSLAPPAQTPHADSAVLAKQLLDGTQAPHATGAANAGPAKALDPKYRFNATLGPAARSIVQEWTIITAAVVTLVVLAVLVYLEFFRAP